MTETGAMGNWDVKSKNSIDSRSQSNETGQLYCFFKARSQRLWTQVHVPTINLLCYCILISW